MSQMIAFFGERSQKGERPGITKQTEKLERQRHDKKSFEIHNVKTRL